MQISFTKRKVQYLYLILMGISLLLGLVSYARAQEMPAPERRPAAVTERIASLSEEKQNRFINLVRNVHTRMDAAITRLESITLRMEQRVTKLQASGVDVSGALPLIAEAKAKLKDAREALQEAKNGAENGLVSETPRERFTESREQFLALKQNIREVFILLRQALAELRDAAQEAELNKSEVVSSSESEEQPQN